MRKRVRKSTTGTVDLITKMVQVQAGEFGVKRPYLGIFAYSEQDEKKRKGDNDSILFNPKEFGGNGLTIACSTEDMAGRTRQFSIQLDENDTKMLIEFLQAHVEGLGRFSGETITDVTNS